MGDPKLPRRVWKKPKRPLNYDLKMEELRTLGTFGLKTKRELWKAHTELSRVRNQARSLLALGREVREAKEPVLIRSLSRIGLVGGGAALDDVLNLQVNDLLGRRLQTIVGKKLGFRTPYQARQAVVHGHIMIGDRVVTVPSYTVEVGEEREIRLAPGSAYKEILEREKEARKASQKGGAEAAPEGGAEGAAAAGGEAEAGKAPDAPGSEGGAAEAGAGGSEGSAGGAGKPGPEAGGAAAGPEAGAAGAAADADKAAGSGGGAADAGAGAGGEGAQAPKQG